MEETVSLMQQKMQARLTNGRRQPAINVTRTEALEGLKDCNR
jgi:hypothetical protein